MTPGGLFAGVLKRGASAEQVSDQAWLQALLDAEAALARASATAGLIAPEQAEQIASACRAERFDATELGRSAQATGNPTAPLARALAEQVGGEAGGQVHRGATSQDIIDTAAMLVAARALDPLIEDLAGAAGAAAQLAERHKSTPMAGRTLLQQAVPITFGLKAAGWLTALDEAADLLQRVRRERLAVQLGGAAGTLAALEGTGLQVMGHMARELGLAEPVVPWHTDRTRIAELAAGLGTACGAIAKIALDVVLLSQTEVAEVHEAKDGSGGSSTMPHKRNPVAAVAARACAAQAPALVATLLTAMAHEHERAAGPWHAEWQPLRDLLAASGSAAAWLRSCLEGLEVDAEQMRRNLELTGGLLLAEHVSGALAEALGRHVAQDLVRAAAADTQGSFAQALQAQPQVRDQLSAQELERLLDPSEYVGDAEQLVERALAAHATRRPTGGR